MGRARAETLAAPAALPPLRLPVNALATAVGWLVYAACQWGLSVVLARLGSPELLGQFAMGIAVAGPVMLLANLQLRAVQVTDAAHANHFSEYLALRLTTATVGFVVIGLVALVVGGGSAGGTVILLVGAIKAIESVSEVYRGSMQQAERMERMAASMMLRGLLSLAGFTVTLRLEGGLPLALVVVVAANLLTWRIWDVWNVTLLNGEPTGRPSRARALFGIAPRFDLNALVALARTALPLGVVAVLLSLTSYAPQWAVRYARGDVALGYFAAVLMLAMASGVLVGAVGMSASPRLASLYEAGEAGRFRSLHRRLLVVAGTVGFLTLAGAAMLGRPALRLVYGPEYAGQAELLVALCAVAALIQIVTVQGIAVTAARRFRGQVPVSIFVAVLSVSLAFALVPMLGSTGAALAMLTGALVQGVGYTALLGRALRDLDRATAGRTYDARL
jgi:O-antigen/teichoic acid export membrane protein